MIGEFCHGGKLYEIKTCLTPLASNDRPFSFASLKDVQAFFAFVMADPFTRREILGIVQSFTAIKADKRTKKYLPPEDEEKLNQLCRELFLGSLVLVRKIIVTMTDEQKEQCAKLFKQYTGYHVEPFRWNEKAADMLADMVWKVEECSRAMGVVSAVIPKKPPPNLKPSWRWWLTNFILDLVKNEDMIERGYVNAECLKQVVGKYKNEIRAELIN
jgi:hypothetical protein